MVVLDNSVESVIPAINNYQGSILEETAANITTVIANSTGGGIDPNALPPSTLSASGAYRIIDTINRTPDVGNPAAVKALKTVTPLFQASGQDGVVSVGLRVLLSKHLYFPRRCGSGRRSKCVNIW